MVNNVRDIVVLHNIAQYCSDSHIEGESQAEVMSTNACLYVPYRTVNLLLPC